VTLTGVTGRSLRLRVDQLGAEDAMGTGTCLGLKPGDAVMELVPLLGES
jgi:hypothetical protein